MYIEFNLASEGVIREIAQTILRNEFKRWCHKHNLDFNSIDFELIQGWNKERVRLPSDRAYELFCISWSPTSKHFTDYRLRKA